MTALLESIKGHLSQARGGEQASSDAAPCSDAAADRYAKMIGLDLTLEERRAEGRRLAEGAPVRRMRPAR